MMALLEITWQCEQGFPRISMGRSDDYCHMGTDACYDGRSSYWL